VKFCTEHITSAHVLVKEKVKCALVQALRLCTGRSTHRGSRGIALLFLDHGTRRKWGVSVTPRQLFTPGKDPEPIVQEAGWAPGLVWTGAENLAPTGIRSPSRPTRSQSLYRLRYPVLVTWRKFLLATLTYLRHYTRGQPASIAFSLRVRQEHKTTRISKCRWMVKVECITTDVLNIPPICVNSQVCITWI